MDHGSRSRPKKAPNAFRTISEVADDLHIPQHVLRFWETKFPQVNPLKRGGGRRYYRPDDIVLLRRIADLLYTQGYTIKGVQRLLREGGGQLSDDIPPPTADERAAAEAEKGLAIGRAAVDPWARTRRTTAGVGASGAHGAAAEAGGRGRAIAKPAGGGLAGTGGVTGATEVAEVTGTSATGSGWVQ